MRFAAGTLAVALAGCSSQVNLGGATPTDEPIGGAGSTGTGASACEGLAFCEIFESAHPGGRGGDIDETRWSFARWAHAVQYFWLRLPANTYPDALVPATFCGAPFSGILPPEDARVCGGPGVDGTRSGQLNEVFDDQGAAAVHSMRIRQPFDFTNRVGRIVWDVDAKFNPHNLGHGFWIEVWITDDPAPLPHDELFGVFSLPQRGVGFGFRYGGNCESTETAWGNSLDAVLVVEDHRVVNAFDDVGYDSPTHCFTSLDGALNHLELRISADDAELWASDHSDPKSFQFRARVEGLGLTFERGYVHFEHVQLAAAADGLEGCENGEPNTCPSATQTFRWDNIGFDGPIVPAPSGYSVPDSGAPGPEGGIYTGWSLNEGQTETLVVPAVDLTDAVSASLDFNAFLAEEQVFEYRFNAGEWHDFSVPSVGEPEATLRGFSLPVELVELVHGDNTLEVRVLDPMTEVEGIGNVDLTLERVQ